MSPVQWRLWRVCLSLDSGWLGLRITGQLASRTPRFGSGGKAWVLRSPSRGFNCRAVGCCGRARECVGSTADDLGTFWRVLSGLESPAPDQEPDEVEPPFEMAFRTRVRPRESLCRRRTSPRQRARAASAIPWPRTG